MNRSPINADYDHYETLVERQTKADKNYNTLRYPVSIPIVVPMRRWGNYVTMEQERL